MGRLWVSDSIHLRSLAWNLRLARRAGRYGDRGDCSIGVVRSLASARFCGGQELHGLEPFGHFGPYRGRKYRGVGSAARSQFYGAVSTAPMTQLPLVLVPTYLVPTFLILHLTALFQARRLGRETTRYGKSGASGEIRISQTA